MLLVLDPSTAAVELAAGELMCRENRCQGVLGPWGHARTRWLRLGPGRTEAHTPRRGNSRWRSPAPGSSPPSPTRSPATPPRDERPTSTRRATNPAPRSTRTKPPTRPHLRCRRHPHPAWRPTDGPLPLVPLCVASPFLLLGFRPIDSEKQHERSQRLGRVGIAQRLVRQRNALPRTEFERVAKGP